MKQQAAGSQTLDRGLEALEVLAAADAAVSVNELAEKLGVHRSSAYRVLRTLEDRRFVVRAADGLIRLGPKIATLARGVTPGLAEAAKKPITSLANKIGMTVFVAVLDADQIVTLVSAEPQTVDVSIARKPGTKHSVLIGAPGHILESAIPAEEREKLFGTKKLSKAALLALENGYAESSNEVIDGVYSLAIPIHAGEAAPFGPGEENAAIALAHFNKPKNTDALIKKLLLTVEEIKNNYQ